MKKKIWRRLCVVIVVGAFLLLVLLVCFFVPHAPKTAAELCGTYILDCELIHGELTLRSDGTFVQTVTINATAETISSNGTWTYVTEKSYGLTFGTLRFQRFISVLKWPDELKTDYIHQTPGAGFLPAEYWLGQLILGGSVDSWPNWKKVK